MTANFYQRALARIWWLTIGFGAAGSIAVAIRYGLRTAFGFAVGAAISVFNLETFRGLAGSLGGEVNKRAITYGILFVIRYGLIGGAVYVIVKYLEVSLMAVFAGLFVSAAAVLAEILYELGFSK